MKVNAYSLSGKQSGSVELDDSVFGIEPNVSVMHQAHLRQLANARLGTSDTKTRGQVSGGGRKPWRQKGTGRARQGSIRAPQWAGGGAVFGPVPRSHAHALPKKVRRAALRGALSLRHKEGALVAVDALALEEPKTKRVVELLGRLGLDGSASLLIVVAGEDAVLERAARNLPRVTVLRVAGLNVYDVLRHQRLLVTRDALDAIHARLGDAPAQEERS